MEKYKELWKKKKADIAKKIMESPGMTAYSYAKELAEMELSEYQCNEEVGENKGSNDSTEKLFMELATVAEPVARFLSENFNAHTAAIITDSQVKVVTDEIGMPLKEEES